jgi:hypothetical protein
MIPQRTAIGTETVVAGIIAVIIAAGIGMTAVGILGIPGIRGICAAPGISCPATTDIVNGQITIGPGQSNYYQFGIPYGVQDLSVNLQWSSSGRVSVYVMNATELIGWQGGQSPQSYYSSAEPQGNVSIQLPADNLYYLVFDNPVSTAQEVVQANSGLSYMCSFCGSSAPVQQPNSSSPSCVSANGSEVCSVTLTNMGHTEATPTGVCVESWSLDEGPVMTWGIPRQGVFSPTTPIPQSSNLTETCTVAGATAPLGLAITVLIPFAGGYNVLMYGPVSFNAPVCTQQGTRLVCTFTINNDAMPGVVATACQIQVGDNVSRWSGTVGGTTLLNSDNRGASFTCSIVGSEPPIGTMVTGFVTFSNRSYALFSSRWS